MNSVSLISFFLLLFCTIANAANQNKQIFIEYGVAHEGSELSKFFYDLHDGFFVDIGSFDAIFASNTLNLVTMGWKGINIDASLIRLPPFTILRKGQPSINSAIGEQNIIVTLFELGNDDSSSTINTKVKDVIQKKNPVVGQSKVHSISMKLLCERFFNRKPNFLNLDIEGHGSETLMSNDWTNDKCVPEIIFAQNNVYNVYSQLPRPEKLLNQYGYKKFKGKIGLNQMFIHASVFDKYTKKYQEGDEIMKNKVVKKLSHILTPLSNHLGKQTYPKRHYDPFTDNIFYHFAREGQSIDISKLNRESNRISQLKNRPIVILNHNPETSPIILPNRMYSSEQVILAPWLKFLKLVLILENRKLSVYILRHQTQQPTMPRVILTDWENGQIQQQIQLNVSRVQGTDAQNKTQGQKWIVEGFNDEQIFSIKDDVQMALNAVLGIRKDMEEKLQVCTMGVKQMRQFEGIKIDQSQQIPQDMNNLLEHAERIKQVQIGQFALLLLLAIMTLLYVYFTSYKSQDHSYQDFSHDTDVSVSKNELQSNNIEDLPSIESQAQRT